MNPTAEDILTFEDCKNSIARDNGFNDWDHIHHEVVSKKVYDELFHEAAELYAKEAASEAFDAGEKYGGMKEHHDLDDHFPDKETYMKKYDTTGS